MFTALGYFGKILDLLNCGYKIHYIILTEPRLQCLVKAGRKYQLLSREKKRNNERQAHNCCFPFHHMYIFISTFVYITKIWTLRNYIYQIYLVSSWSRCILTVILMSIMHLSVICSPVLYKCITVENIAGYISWNVVTAVVLLVSNFIAWK